MLSNLINSPKKCHAIIFNISVQADVENIVNNYIKSIVVDGLPNNQQTIYQKKIDDGTYYDIIKVNGFTQGIKKEDVLNIQNTFFTGGVEEANKKFYIIYGIENITTQAANSLLKFLENPPHNTYAIFVTKAPNRIIETIKSRCQIYFITPNKDKFNTLIKEFKIKNKNLIKIASKYPSLQELRNDLSSNQLQDIYQLADELINSSKKSASLKKLLDTFKTLSYSQIENLINFISIIDEQKEMDLYSLKNVLKYNPNKVLLFNKIIETTK